MRELKFRAWKEVNGKMHRWICPPIPRASDFIEISQDMDIRNFIKGADVIEQYTGLKDKNDKEIYEGDIVDYNDDGECIGIVEYDAPEFYLNADATNWARMFLKGTPHQKVIGNVHENPELLEKYEQQILG